MKSFDFVVWHLFWPARWFLLAAFIVIVTATRAGRWLSAIEAMRGQIERRDGLYCVVPHGPQGVPVIVATFRSEWRAFWFIVRHGGVAGLRRLTEARPGGNT